MQENIERSSFGMTPEIQRQDTQPLQKKTKFLRLGRILIAIIVSFFIVIVAISVSTYLEGSFNFSNGILEYSQGNYQEALKQYTQSINLNPNRPEVYYNRGLVYGALGDYEAAIADYTEAIRLQPDFALSYINRGTMYVRLQNYDAALADCKEAARLDPNEPLAYYNAGLIFTVRQNYDEALSNFNEAIRLDPNNAESYVFRGFAIYQLYETDEDLEKVLADWEKAESLGYELPQIYQNMRLVIQVMLD